MITRTHANEAVKALLVANDLPIEDLDDPSIELFVLNDGARMIGVVGLQWLDGCALLRSLAVDEAARSGGHGSTLCDAAVSEAKARGASELWLLTTTARDYFIRRGFDVVARDATPATVQSTAQFSSLCPASASVMRRRLGE